MYVCEFFCICLLVFRPIYIFSISISISMGFSIAQTPTVRPRAHYLVIVSCYLEQYARLKRNVFSPRRKADRYRLCSFQFSRQLVSRSR